jgi:hypothetical protein
MTGSCSVNGYRSISIAFNFLYLFIQVNIPNPEFSPLENFFCNLSEEWQRDFAPWDGESGPAIALSLCK